MSDVTTLKGWTDGADAVVDQSCAACRHIWYFHRTFCPWCGDASPRTQRASGRGTVYAATVVRRAATPETKAYVPYAILLVDLAEGFRIMAHGDADLNVGDSIAIEFRTFVGLRTPYAVRTV